MTDKVQQRGFVGMCAICSEACYKGCTRCGLCGGQSARDRDRRRVAKALESQGGYPLPMMAGLSKRR